MIGLTLLRDYLRLLEDQHEDDDLIEELEANAVAIVETNTGFRYPTADNPVIEHVRGLGTNELFLSFAPTADPDEVLERLTVDAAGTAITGSVLRGNRLFRASGVWVLNAGYQLSFAGGYDTDSEPGDVRQAVMQIVGILYRGRGKDGLMSETVGGQNSTYTYDKIDDAIKAITDTLPHRGVLT